MAATQTKELEIMIPAVQIGRAEIHLRGLTPLLTNKFSPTALQEMEDKQMKRAKVEKAPRDPDAAFREALHIIDERVGRYGFPASGMKKALVAAGYRLGGEQMTKLRAVFSIEAELLEIGAPAPAMRKDPVHLSAGPWTIAYRPEFWPWEIVVPVLYMTSMVTLEQLINLFRLAGMGIGIGCWRPETNGLFGQFEVTGARTAEGTEK